MKLTEAVSYIERIKDLAINLHGTLTAIEIPHRMYVSIRRALEEAHCYGQVVPVSDAIKQIEIKNKSISVDLVCIWPEDKAPAVCEWDEILYTPLLKQITMERSETDPIACLSRIIDTGYMLTMERPEKFRMNAAAIHELNVSMSSSHRIVSMDAGLKVLVVNGVRMVPLPCHLTHRVEGASATTMTVDERLPVDDRVYRELNKSPWDQEPWEEFGSVIWKGQKEKPKDLFDLEKEMELLIKNLKG